MRARVVAAAAATAHPRRSAQIHAAMQSASGEQKEPKKTKEFSPGRESPMKNTRTWVETFLERSQKEVEKQLLVNVAGSVKNCLPILASVHQKIKNTADDSMRVH